MWMLWLLVTVLPVPVSSEREYAFRLSAYIVLTFCMQLTGMIAVLFFRSPEIPWRIGVLLCFTVPIHLVAWGTDPKIVWIPLACSFIPVMINVVYIFLRRRLAA